MNRFGTNPFTNDIDRQSVFGVPIVVIFALAVSAVAFGGVAGQVGVFDAISDLISKFSRHEDYIHMLIIKIKNDIQKNNKLLNNFVDPTDAPAPAPIVTQAPAPAGNVLLSMYHVYQN